MHIKSFFDWSALVLSFCFSSLSLVCSVWTLNCELHSVVQYWASGPHDGMKHTKFRTIIKLFIDWKFILLQDRRKRLMSFSNAVFNWYVIWTHQSCFLCDMFRDDDLPATTFHSLCSVLLPSLHQDQKIALDCPMALPDHPYSPPPS